MDPVAYRKLVADLEYELIHGAQHVGILGLSTVTLRLLDSLEPSGMIGAVVAIYTSNAEQHTSTLSVPLRPFHTLEDICPDVLVVAADVEKEDLILEALPF